MDHKSQEQIALHRWAVIAEAAGPQLTAAERGALARQIAARSHAHPDGSSRTYSRGTIDRWLRAWRKGGLDALRPSPRADTGVVRAHPELFAEAAALPGWLAVGRWRFASAVSGGRLIAANITSPFLIVGRRRFMPPVPPLPA